MTEGAKEKKKTIVLGVTGSIAAYKSCELVSLLVKQNVNVHVVLTKGAAEFVAPLTFQTLSQNPCLTDIFTNDFYERTVHIHYAEKADLVVVAPCDANVIGKLAHGIADDLLTTLVLATRAPLFVAPAMNVQMYENAAVQENIEVLKKRGVKIIDPGEGRLACGAEGVGKLADVDKIYDEIMRFLKRKKDFAGKNMVITAGCTQEPLDPIRYLSNYSSGRMGFCLAEEAAARGARVFLVCGPTHLALPHGSGIKVTEVKTAKEMYDAVFSVMPRADVFIGAAAVMDFRPKHKSQEKIKKDALTGKEKKQAMVLELEENEDILLDVKKKFHEKVCVGFAAETHRLIEHAKEKLKKKQCDFIVANKVSGEGKGEGEGMASEYNAALLILKDGRMEDLPRMTKRELSGKILDVLLKTCSERT